MSPSSPRRRWLVLAAAGVAATIALAGLLILPELVNLIPLGIRNHSIDLLAMALVVAFAVACKVASSQSKNDPSRWRLTFFLDRLDAVSRWALDGGLSIVLTLVIAVMLASWVPHYLTWPWCRDTDTFATIAQCWEAGIRPYRDIRGYNFPGHIYLHWLLGRTLGWGNTSAFYAFDATALLTLGAVLGAWSRRRLGGALPGLVAYVAFLSFYLSLDYQQVAQRDWHATLAAALAIMVIEAFPGRGAIWIAATLEAVALSIRPHAVLFLPAMASAIAERPRAARTGIEWAIALVLFTAIGFAPLVAHGILDDLVRGLRVAAYGGPYSQASFPVAVGIIAHELSSPLLPLMLVCLIGLWVKGGDPGSLARTWSLALVAGLVYRAPHPVQHGYLASALALIGSISLAVPVAWLMGLSGLARPMRLLAILLILGQAVPRAPFFCAPLESIRALGPLARGVAPADPPPGCRVRSFQPKFSHYSWTDYCRALEYLRRTTTQDTEIANVLKQPPYPCFNGPLGRLSPFRSESGICWMLLVDMDLDDEFARELEQSPHSVVVWSPSEIGLDSPLKLPRLTDLISELYRREARFGPIEVWRRAYNLNPDPIPKSDK